MTETTQMGSRFFVFHGMKIIIKLFLKIMFYLQNTATIFFRNIVILESKLLVYLVQKKM